MASSKYWQEREDDWTKECQANNVQWHQKLQDIYQTMNDEISEQIAVFYQKYADENGLTYAQAKQYLDRTDIRYYSRLAKRYCEDAAKDMAAGTWAHDAAKSYFTQQANQEMKRYNTAMKIARLDMLKRQISLRIANAQRKACSVVEDALNDRILQTYTRQAGILGDTVLTNLKHVSTIAHASFHGATFSDRIWGTQQAKLKKALNKALQDCLILGKGAAPFTRELKKATGKTTRECQRLISTELSRVRVQASLDSFKACGFDEFQIIANPDCCKKCQAINGEHFPLPKLASGENAPPMHPNCRCSIAPYEARDEDSDKDFDEAAFDEWSDTYDEHGLSWEDWKRQRDNQIPIANQSDRNVSQKERGVKIPITEQAPSKVRVIKPDGYSEEIAHTTRAIREQLLIHSRDYNNSDECAALVNLTTGEKSKWIDGDINSVDIEKDVEGYHLLSASPPRSLELTHNHPGQSYFSLNDLNVFLYWPSIKCITIVTNQGKSWYLNKTDDFDIKALAGIMKKHQEAGLTGDDLVKAFVKDGQKAGLERG